MKDIYIIK